MTKRILVTYATGAGSTAQVADAMGEELRDEEITVDVRHVSDVEDISPYSSVVIGSSIRAGRWLPAAVDFLEDFEVPLSAMPVAYFTTCLTMVNDTADSRRTVTGYMEPLRHIAPRVKPIGLGLFAGSLNPDLRRVLPGESGPYGDYRNWDAIRGWARQIRPLLLTGETHQSAPIFLRDSVLSYTDLSGLDLSDVNMAGTEMEASKLHDANLQGSNLRGSSLAHADLRRADLRGAGLHWADLSHADCQEANLTRANLMGAILQDANLRGANLTKALLNGATLTNTKLVGAILVSADLNWANLSHADLSDADLQNANLGWADLGQANLTNTNLNNAGYNSHTTWPNTFSPEDAGCIFIDAPQ